MYEVNFSFTWINYIFSKFKINNFYDTENKFDYFRDNSIIVVSVNQNTNDRLVKYISDFNKNGLNYTILHLSDENYDQNIDFYSVSKKIIRNYYNEDYSSRYNLITIPLGFQTGLKKYKNDKTYDINFIGQMKSDRNSMLGTFLGVEEKFIHLTQMWNDPNGLNIDEYSYILGKSWFTLCPRGWVNIDSFRINESLECSSIPITILDNGIDYFEKIYGEYPFIVGDNWEDSYNKYINCNRFDLSNDCQIWWSDFKENLKTKLKKFIEQ
jgi:hypothetical protein